MLSRSPQVPPGFDPSTPPSDDDRSGDQVDPFEAAARSAPPPRSPQLPQFQAVVPQPQPRSATAGAVGASGRVDGATGATAELSLRPATTPPAAWPGSSAPRQSIDSAMAHAPDAPPVNDSGLDRSIGAVPHPSLDRGRDPDVGSGFDQRFDRALDPQTSPPYAIPRPIASSGDPGYGGPTTPDSTRWAEVGGVIGSGYHSGSVDRPGSRRPSESLGKNGRSSRTGQRRQRRQLSPEQAALRRQQRDLLYQRLNQLLRGKLLLALFTFWALLWLVGGVAAVRLFSARLEPEPLVLRSEPGASLSSSPAAGQSAPSLAGESNAPNGTTTDPNDAPPGATINSGTGDGSAAELRGSTTDRSADRLSDDQLTDPSHDRPPVGILAGVVVLSAIACWWRLKQIRS